MIKDLICLSTKLVSCLHLVKYFLHAPKDMPFAIYDRPARNWKNEDFGANDWHCSEAIWRKGSRVC